MRHRVRAAGARAALCAATLVAACSGPPRGELLVTTEPVSAGRLRICVAVALDPEAPREEADFGDVSWWMPGASGCSTRSSSIESHRAIATPVGDDVFLRFSIPLIPEGSEVVTLRLRSGIDDTALLGSDGRGVPMQSTSELDIPEE
jgi:hypothetical protein